MPELQRRRDHHGADSDPPAAGQAGLPVRVSSSSCASASFSVTSIPSTLATSTSWRVLRRQILDTLKSGPSMNRAMSVLLRSGLRRACSVQRPSAKARSAALCRCRQLVRLALFLGQSRPKCLRLFRAWPARAMPVHNQSSRPVRRATSVNAPALPPSPVSWLTTTGNSSSYGWTSTLANLLVVNLQVHRHLSS